MGWRGFGFVHHSRAVFCRAVPNPNLTIRNVFIAVQGGGGGGGGVRAPAPGHAAATVASPALRVGGVGGFYRQSAVGACPQAVSPLAASLLRVTLATLPLFQVQK
jgi:hypothetical protein